MSENTENPTELDAIIAAEPTLRTADQAPGEPAPPIPPPAPAPEPAVTVGRIVHYREFADVECDCVATRAALVVHVWGPECCNLIVYGRDGSTTVRTSATKGEGVGTWSYPVRA